MVDSVIARGNVAKPLNYAGSRTRFENPIPEEYASRWRGLNSHFVFSCFIEHRVADKMINLLVQEIKKAQVAGTTAAMKGMAELQRSLFGKIEVLTEVHTALRVWFFFLVGPAAAVDNPPPNLPASRPNAAEGMPSTMRSPLSSISRAECYFSSFGFGDKARFFLRPSERQAHLFFRTWGVFFRFVADLGAYPEGFF